MLAEARSEDLTFRGAVLSKHNLVMHPAGVIVARDDCVRVSGDPK